MPEVGKQLSADVGCFAAVRSCSRMRVIRNPVRVRKKNSPISNGQGPRQFVGTQCCTSLPAPRKHANRRVEYFESPPRAGEAVMGERDVQCLDGLLQECWKLCSSHGRWKLCSMWRGALPLLLRRKSSAPHPAEPELPPARAELRALRVSALEVGISR